MVKSKPFRIERNIKSALVRGYWQYKTSTQTLESARRRAQRLANECETEVRVLDTTADGWPAVFECSPERS